MPNIKSAKKRVLVTEVKTLQNKMKRSEMKTAIKKFEAAVAAGDKEAASAHFNAVVRKLDRAAARGLIHKNCAAHKKSQFAKALQNM
ncbi:MAG: 30S ribosomal protein S20 [Clostridia bacterium]|nr:30S ribosomal protein S20 [Clostridia bacterium]